MAVTSAVAMTITAITAVAGGVLTAVNMIQQGDAAQAAANRQAQAEEYQARQKDMEARIQAAQLQKEAARVASSQTTSAAAAGINLGSTSLLDIMKETQINYARDVEQLKLTGQLASSAGRYSAQSYRLAGKAEKAGSWWGAGAGFLGGLSSGMGYGNEAGWFGE